MSAIKCYMENVISTTATAMFTETKDELKAYGDYDSQLDLECELFEMMVNEGAKSVWDMACGLIGDMDWNAAHPLLDEAKNQILTLIPFGELAKDLAEFYWDFDPYDFKNSCDSMNEAIEANIEILESGDEGTLEWLNSCLEEMDGDDHFKEMIVTCKSLIPRVQKSMELAAYHRS